MKEAKGILIQLTDYANRNIKGIGHRNTVHTASCTAVLNVVVNEI